jgi:protein-S-isoprenylcysteine O-methyltransferase Ste14
MLPLWIWLLLFLPAGSFNYWQVYAYFGVILSCGFIAYLYFSKHDPALIERRMRTAETEQTQQIVIAFVLTSVVAGYVVSGLDQRFGWSDISITINLVALLFVMAGYIFTAYVMKTNSYASRVIEVEQGQEVIKTGPYAVVRHPMYAGASLMFIATPIALGSWWGIFPFVVVILLMSMRILNEEDVLRKDLRGYADYCQEVRWRLIPGVW